MIGKILQTPVTVVYWLVVLAVVFPVSLFTSLRLIGGACLTDLKRLWK
jgi:hypothetical protein